MKGIFLLIEILVNFYRYRYSNKGYIIVRLTEQSPEMIFNRGGQPVRQTMM